MKFGCVRARFQPCRPSVAQDNSSGTYYVQGSCANGVASNGVCYSPPGAVGQMINGTNLTTTLLYNNRLQPCWIYATTGTALATTTSCTASDSNPGTILDLKYSLNWGAGDNGNVIGITNNRDNTRSQSFTYDQVNRLLTAETTSTYSTSPTHCWGEAYEFDNQLSGAGAWGNLTNINVVSTSYNGCSQESLSVTATANNQLSATGYSYDASGNMLSDGHNSYEWYSEGSLEQAAGQSYMYDGRGNRIEKAGVKFYYYGLGSQVLDESDTSGNVTDEYVYLGSQRVAHITASGGSVYYYGQDHLGTSRVMVAAGGTSPCYDADFYPFGGERAYTTTCTQNYKFTAKERDSESGLDNFRARFNSSNIGRFMSPDPLLNSGRPTDPQTWNRYSYVRDNPLNGIDPTGLYGVVCGNDKQCKSHANDLKVGLEKLQKQADKMKDGPQKERLEAALKAIGTEGDNNGVSATFGKLAGTAAAQTDLHSDASGQLSATVTFDPSKINGQEEFAIDAAHEGTHIEDFLTQAVNDTITFGSLQSLSPFSSEYRGYQTSIYAASALGLTSFSRTYDGVTYVLWNGSWAQVDKNITNFVTRFHDQNGVPDHPETTPHNPWPN